MTSNQLKLNKKEIKYLVLIMIIFIAACIETDIYLPAFPDMMDYFSVSEEGIQQLLTWNLAGMCLSGPFYGPISDSFGRKKPLMVTLAFFLIGSILTLFAKDFPLMLWGRVLQGIGSGGIFTLGTAIIFDAFPSQKGIHALNKLNSINPFLFAAAPLLGGYLNHFYGFRSNFLAIAVVVLLSFILCLFFFEETHAPRKRVPFQINKIIKDFKVVLTHFTFWQLTLIISLLFTGYLVFLSGIAVLFIIDMGVSKENFPLYQAAILGANLLASLTCSPAIRFLGLKLVKLLGATAVFLGGMGLAVCALFSPRDPLLMTSLMMFYSFGYMWVQTPYCGEIMDIVPEIKGIAASVLTSARVLMTALVVGIASTYYDTTIRPITIVVLGILAVVLPTMLIYEKKKAQSSS